MQPATIANMKDTQQQTLHQMQKSKRMLAEFNSMSEQVPDCGNLSSGYREILWSEMFEEG